jgi:hypothetical protein
VSRRRREGNALDLGNELGHETRELGNRRPVLRVGLREPRAHVIVGPRAEPQSDLGCPPVRFGEDPPDARAETDRLVVRLLDEAQQSRDLRDDADRIFAACGGSA